MCKPSRARYTDNNGKDPTCLEVDFLRVMSLTKVKNESSLARYILRGNFWYIVTKPADAVTPVCDRISVRRRAAMLSGSPSPVTSRYASSHDTGSTTEVAPSRILYTCSALFDSENFDR